MTRIRYVLPARGEFGLKIRYHVPAVHAMPPEKVVYMEAGEEALYPSASERVPVQRPPDHLRRGTHPRGDHEYIADLRAEIHTSVPGAEVIQTRKGMAEARFQPRPWRPWDEFHIRPDIVICPRGREYGSSKNWPYWDALTEGLKAHGLRVFAAGAPDSSMTIKHIPLAWDWERFLDASIVAMRRARLVISTDAGLAHLAMLTGSNLLIITAGGLVAPGPVVDPGGKAMKSRYWPVRLKEYYEDANHMDAHLETWDGWHNPFGLMRRAVTLLETLP